MSYIHDALKRAQREKEKEPADVNRSAAATQGATKASSLVDEVTTSVGLSAGQIEPCLPASNSLSGNIPVGAGGGETPVPLKSAGVVSSRLFSGKQWARHRRQYGTFGRANKRRLLISIFFLLCAVASSTYSWLHFFDSRSRSRIGAAAGELNIAYGPTISVDASKSQELPAVMSTPTPASTEATNLVVSKSKVRKRQKAVIAITASPPLQPPAAAPITLTPNADVRVNATMQYNKALNHQKQGEFLQAKKLYEDVIKISPGFAPALNNLSALHVREKDYEKAQALLKLAISSQPDYADAQYNLACLYALQKNTKMSLDHLRQAVKLNKQVQDWAKTDADLSSLRGNAEYERIIEGDTEQ